MPIPAPPACLSNAMPSSACQYDVDWFNNVELIAARKIGAETVTYVSNIYKYYAAYKIVTEQAAKKPR